MLVSVFPALPEDSVGSLMEDGYQKVGRRLKHAEMNRHLMK
jgi:hypothetical protein